MSFSILLVGCGELGSRHLQAIASLPEGGCIEVADPRPAAKELGIKRLGENLGPVAPVRWLASIEDARPNGALCIIATQAHGRFDLVRRAAHLGYKKFLIEKIVSPSLLEYREMMAFADEHCLSVWVNCKTRAYPIHQKIKSMLPSGVPVAVTALGGNLGLATNGVHVADLFLFLDGSDEIEPAGVHIDPAAYRSKRGNGIFDLSGILAGRSSKGGSLAIVYQSGHSSPDLLTIAGGPKRWVVDHVNGWAYESNEATGWALKETVFDKDILVSKMTRRFAEEIINDNRCGLPTLKECFPSHQFVLGQLAPHFERLVGVGNGGRDYCPVT